MHDWGDPVWQPVDMVKLELPLRLAACSCYKDSHHAFICATSFISSIHGLASVQIRCPCPLSIIKHKPVLQALMVFGDMVQYNTLAELRSGLWNWIVRALSFAFDISGLTTRFLAITIRRYRNPNRNRTWYQDSDGSFLLEKEVDNFIKRPNPDELRPLPSNFDGDAFDDDDITDPDEMDTSNVPRSDSRRDSAFAESDVQSHYAQDRNA